MAKRNTSKDKSGIIMILAAITVLALSGWFISFSLNLAQEQKVKECAKHNKIPTGERAKYEKIDGINVKVYSCMNIETTNNTEKTYRVINKQEYIDIID